MKTQETPLNRTDMNRSLWRDLERRLGTSDLLQWLENETERVANLGRTHTGCVRFSQSLLRDRAITIIRAGTHLPALATIRPVESGYEIAYASFARAEDQRFAIAHEISHTFWFAPGVDGRPLSPLQRALGDDPTIEWLCNRAAAAMLLPRSDVSELVEHAPNVLHEIPDLARRYVIPERLVARRIFHDLGDSEMSVAGVRLENGKNRPAQAKVAWLAALPGRAKTKKRVEGRIVPIDLLPDVPVGTTAAVDVDGRWLMLLESATKRDRSKPLSACSRLPPRRAWVARTSDVWYLAIRAE